MAGPVIGPGESAGGRGRDHEDVRVLLPELAVNAADAGDRAVALEHLSGCPACRAELAGLAELVDGLLVLAPAVTPPAGFAAGLEAEMRGGGPAVPPLRRGSAPAVLPRPRRGRPWPAVLTGIAAALVVGIGAAAVTGVVVWRNTADDRRLAAHYRQEAGDRLRSVPLVGPDGAHLGTAFAHQGEPSWIYVTFDGAPAPGRYDVALVTADGRSLPLRVFTATATSTGWGSTVVDLAQIRALRFARGDDPAMVAEFA